LADELLYLWRGIQSHNASPQYQFSDQGIRPKPNQEFFAPFNGTMERFRIRVHFNTQLGPVTIHFLKNNNIQRTIGPVPSLATGIFLPDNQGATPFDKDDLLVMEILGADSPESIQMELQCDLRFNDTGQVEVPLPDAVVLQLETGGSSFNLIHQFSHFTKRPLDVGSSTVGAALKGKIITHIRMKVGNVVNNHRIYLAVYEGDTDETATVRSVSVTFDQSTMIPGQVYDVPLTVPYVIGTDVVSEISICTAVVDGSPGVEFAGDSTNSARLRLGYNGPGNPGDGVAVPPAFPGDFDNSPDNLANEAPLQRLINENTIAGGILPIP